MSTSTRRTGLTMTRPMTRSWTRSTKPVREGKVRILGCSNETSWGLMKSLAASERLGVARYHTIQNNFSLNNRRFEDELAQVCRQRALA